MHNPGLPLSRDIESAVAPSLPESLTLAVLSGRPWLVATTVAVWAGSGLVVAVVLGRRGHDVRSVGVLGILLGPFLLGVAHANLIPRESTAGPIEIEPGDPAQRPGARILVTVLGAAGDVADALPVLRSMAGASGGVTLARPISFESAEDPEWDDEKQQSARVLADAAAHLTDASPAPRLLLVPGRGHRALAAFIERDEADIVVAVGAGSDLAGVCKHVREPTAVVMGPREDHRRAPAR